MEHSIVMKFEIHYSTINSFIHSYLTQTAQVTKLLDAAKILRQILIFLVYRAQQRRRRQTQTDGSCHKTNVT